MTLAAVERYEACSAASAALPLGVGAAHAQEILCRCYVEGLPKRLLQQARIWWCALLALAAVTAF